MNKYQLFVLLVVSLFFSSCSTISTKHVSQSSQKARLLLEQARREELKNNSLDARELYMDSEYNSILANDLDLQLISLQGQARIAYDLDDSLAFHRLVSKMTRLVEDIKPELFYRVYQIKVWHDFRRGEFIKILSYDQNLKKLPLNSKIEALSYTLQAKASLQIERSNDRNMLIACLKTYNRRIQRKQKIHPDLISNAYYSLAYSDIVDMNFIEADKMICKAIELDKRYDLYINLADDYALAGKSQLLQKNYVKARAYISYAQQLYAVTNQPDKADSMYKLLNNTSGK
jgi:hypothetical protein